MRNNVLHRFLFILLLSILAIIFAPPATFWAQILGEQNPLVQRLSAFRITLGLDLAGGTELDYKVDLSEALAQNQDEDPNNDVNIDAIVESVRDALERRVNPAGVGEIVVKRSKINNEEHILIQMPPSSNVEKAKRDAEKDNRLEFFAESPGKILAQRVKLAKLLTVGLTPENWETKTKKILEKDPKASIETYGPVFKESIRDKKLAETLFNAKPGDIIQEVFELTIDPVIQVNADGKIVLDELPIPKDVVGIVRLVEKKEGERVKEQKAMAHARHILIPYPGAREAPEELPYKSKEEARKKAEGILAELKKGADFATLAKEYSFDPGSKENGGDLGTFPQGRMVPSFDEAVFSQKEPGLVDKIVESPYGFHIIKVESLTPAKRERVKEPQVTYEILYWDKDDILWEKTPLSGAHLEVARVGYDQVGNPLVDLRFNEEGAKLFAEITEKLAKEKCGSNKDQPCRLGIKVGGEWISQPYVHQKIVGRNAQITGNFTYESAKQLADDLNLGAIQAPVILSGQTTIKAELGEKQLQKSLRAAAIGLFATILFMILTYRLAGVVASIALLLYIGLFILILKFWPSSLGGPIVLTLPGAAGIALSVGLAVDGNILIFERMKEELQKGRTLLQAVDLGFERAWSAIRDSNLTTLITCTILFSFGSSIIKGFAITLIVGTILSMFTAITISRNLLRLLLSFKALRKPWLYAMESPQPKKKGKK